MKFVEGMPELISDLRDRNKRLNGFLFAEFGPKDHPTLVFPKPVPGDIASNKPATKGYSCQSYLVVHNMGFLRIALVEGPAEMYSTPRIKELLTSGLERRIAFNRTGKGEQEKTLSGLVDSETYGIYLRLASTGIHHLHIGTHAWINNFSREVLHGATIYDPALNYYLNYTVYENGIQDAILINEELARKDMFNPSSYSIPKADDFSIEETVRSISNFLANRPE